MFQPRMKLHFIERFCNPAKGWTVFVDIDPSEEGLTGGQRRAEEARLRQADMQEDARVVRESFKRLGVYVGRRATAWRRAFGTRLPRIPGDRDIIAVNEKRRIVLIAEVEGESSGQPEQKLYRSIGQMVTARKECTLPDFSARFYLVVPPVLRAHLLRASALAEIGIQGLVIRLENGYEYVF
jgi:hypothetical protein